MTNEADLAFSCRCGAVTGTLTAPGPSVGDHVVCHCTDCQAFANRLGAGDHILDDHAGTALYQGRCAAMMIDSGRDRLASMHLTEAPTLRWYADCCKTPIFNTYKNGRVPFVTTLVANCDAGGRERLLGRPIGHLFLGEATGDVSALTPLSTFTLMRRFFRRMIADIVTGSRKRAALFDAKTLEPIARPYRVQDEA